MKNLCLLAILSICVPALFAGCGPMGIPRSASVCSQGPHPGCTSPSAGQFWVYDKTSGAVVSSPSVERNQDISVDPAANQVTIDGSPVQVNSPLQAGHDYEIYFNHVGK